MPRATEPLLTGVYKHYKGPLYLVLGYGHDANDSQRLGIVYLGLELTDAHHGPRLAFRTATDFNGRVCAHRTQDAVTHADDWCGRALYSDHEECPNHRANTVNVRRFTYVAPDL